MSIHGWLLISIFEQGAMALRKDFLLESLLAYNKLLMRASRIFHHLHEETDQANLLADLSGMILDLSQAEGPDSKKLSDLKDSLVMLAASHQDKDIFTVLVLSSAVNGALALQKTCNEQVTHAQTKIHFAIRLIVSADDYIPEGFRVSA